MLTHPKKFGRYLLVAVLAMLAAILLSGCAQTILANDGFDECKQCQPPESDDKSLAEYSLCQAHKVDVCRSLLGKQPEYKWD